VIWSILAVVHLAIVGVTMLHLLSRPDLSSMTRLAWAFAVVWLSVLGVLLYFLFGNIRFGGRIGKAHRAAERATRDMVRTSGAAPDLPRYGPASGFATEVMGFGVTEGNRAELLDSPDGQRARLIEDIDAAKRFINVFYYIWLDDGTGRSVAAALIRAAKRGVKVRAGVDALGSHALLGSDVWTQLADAGIETTVALPIGNPLVTAAERRPDLRNHRKIFVADGTVLHCGSQNCADPAFSPKPAFAPWVDVMVRFEGPVARQMDLVFAWTWFDERPIDLAPWDYEVTPLDGGVTAQVVCTGPTLHKGITAQLISRILGEARREIMITTPYFYPGDTVADAIMGAAAAGVDVTLTVPRRNDSGFVGPASRALYPLLLRAGVKIMEFEGGLLHSKLLTVDGELTLIGSTNLDFRSFDLNFENDVLVRDAAFTDSIRRRQLEYSATAVPVTQAEVDAWPVWKRIWYNAFTTIGPLI